MAGIALVRMTPSEGVLAAWTFVQRGSYVVDVAGVVSTHALPAATLAQPGADLRLAALATGPNDDAVAVFERAPRTASGFDTAEQAILAARSLRVAALPRPLGRRTRNHLHTDKRHPPSPTAPGVCHVE